MSKTSQENKKIKLATEEKETKVKSRKAKTEIEETKISETPVEATSENITTEETPVSEEKAVKQAKKRGKKYLSVKSKVDINKYYPLSEAVKLAKETSFSKFDGKIEAHITTFDIGNVGEIAFPHMETASKKVVILNDTILAELKEGKVNFDILVATPATMPKLLPFARTLGPKGLMPNPKTGTLTDKPEEAVKKLAAAKTMIKTEKKAPVIHIVVGKVSQDAKELATNIKELIDVVKANKIKKLSICATMGPSIKIAIEK
jgi:large subunit ribosomal protein L1